MTKEEFIEELEKLNIKVTEEKLSKLEKYYELIIEYNNKINLTTIIKKEDVYLKHFYDSLTLVKSYNLEEKISICDIGTGAGFPGIVLKIFFPNLKVTLVESLTKRVKFLNYVIEQLDLKDIEVFNERAEIFSKRNVEKFDVVTCRAVSKLNIILELCVKMTKVNGYIIPMKSNIEEELKNISNCLDKLDCKIEKIIEFNLPFENSRRNLVKIKKVNITNNKYPRNFDKIKKNPL